jgi:hypothetical protein
MKKLSIRLLSALALFHVYSFSVEAQVKVSTDPVGFINITIQGTDSGAGLSAISVPMLPQVIYSGVIHSVSSTTEIVDNAATWQTGDYVGFDPDSNPTYYIEITKSTTDPAIVGTILRITASDDASNTLSVLGDEVTSDFVGASYVVRQFRTLGDLFKDHVGIPDGIKAASSPADADIIYKIGPDGQGGLTWHTYYYQTGRSGSKWQRLGSTTDMYGVTIMPDEGLLIKRIENTDLVITVAGSVKSNASRTAILPGFNLVSLSFPVDKSLSELGLYTSDDSTGLTGGSSLADPNLDRLYSLDDAGEFVMYYYYIPARGGSAHWRKLGSTDNQDDTVIKAGSAIIVMRQTASNRFDWSFEL